MKFEEARVKLSETFCLEKSPCCVHKLFRDYIDARDCHISAGNIAVVELTNIRKCKASEGDVGAISACHVQVSLRSEKLQQSSYSSVVLFNSSIGITHEHRVHKA